jgi:hypothetical protein
MQSNAIPATRMRRNEFGPGSYIYANNVRNNQHAKAVLLHVRVEKLLDTILLHSIGRLCRGAGLACVLFTLHQPDIYPRSLV